MWRSYKTAKAAIIHLKNLHKIPCSKCLYFTGEYSLKCTVNPSTALSEAAIDCRDFELCSRRNNYPLKENIRKKYCHCDSFKPEKRQKQNCLGKANY